MTFKRIFAGLLTFVAIGMTVGAAGAPQAQAAGVLLVDYDDATARQHGEFPTRLQLALLTERLHAAGARAVMLKFFLDGAGDAAGNAALTQALGKGRSLLQASISSDPPTTRVLDARFNHPAPLTGITPAIAGSEGWLPLPTFAQAAASICFADIQRPDQAPLFELFGGKPVPTLFHCVLSETTGGARPDIKPGLAKFGHRQWALNPAGEVSLKLGTAPALPRLSASRVLSNETGLKDSIKGKLAIVMYTGPKSPRRDINGQSMKVHDAFAVVAAALVAAGGNSPQRP